MRKVGFVGGGQMATALAGGAVKAGIITPEHLVFSEPNPAQQKKLAEQFPDVTIVDDLEIVAKECERIILAVKPHILQALAPQLATHLSENHLVISIAAGLSLDYLQTSLNTARVIRVMPNTPSLVGEGAAGFSAPPTLTADDIQWVESFMSSVGAVVQTPDNLLHAVTGISGSSPAYIYMIIEALSDGGVAKGLPRDVATQLAAQSVLGAAKMVLETGLHPGELKDRVTSPGGTTIAAIRTLEKAGVRSALIEAVVQAAERSQELSS